MPLRIIHSVIMMGVTSWPVVARVWRMCSWSALSCCGLSWAMGELVLGG